MRLFNPYQTFSGWIIGCFTALAITFLLACLGLWVIGRLYPQGG